MKKIILLTVFSASVLSCAAQFFQGFGIMAGATAGRQRWDFYSPDSKSKSKYLLRYNGEIFAEFFDNPTFRWVTELQYNVKGAKFEGQTTNPVGTGTVTNKYTNQYAAWNNYLMIRREMVSIIPYAKVGPRLEYVFSSQQSFKKFHVTGALGAGVEFVAYGPVKFLTEAWWVPDLAHSYTSDHFDIRQHCWELRVGLKFTFSHGESCPRVYT
ncbi:MAG TPA: outer membrane beta-barrel protein [Bacteroidia bacterium]|nr:outer membrane beta-barrel protein [Bacteroidia bacterium]